MINCYDFDFDILKNDIIEYKLKSTHDGKIFYLNLPFAFDIETTSFFDINGEKRAIMYIFMMSLNGNYVYGRTWEDFDYILNKLQEVYKLNKSHKLIIYIHNLSYEFQFLIGHTKISNVFARDERHPLKCTINDYFELKCSYFLSGLSLEKTAENLTHIKISKKIGDLDYTKIRHNKTNLTSEELGYCEYDVRILHYFILEEMEKNNNNITEIPLTKTGYVRKYCYKYISTHTNYKYYRNYIKSISPLNVELFSLLHKCFQGGYTHANSVYVGLTLENVYSIDFTSSYPAQMIRHKYPIKPFIEYFPHSLKDFKKIVSERPCIMEISFTYIKSKTSNNILSRSKCSLVDNGIFDNGRIYSADRICTYFTDIDFTNFVKFYTYENIKIHKMYISTYGYLPKELLECVLHFFSEKTVLKGINGKEQEYLVGKGMLNGIYGTCVTNPVNDDITFNNNEWGKKEKDIYEALLENYVKNNKQFLVYQWGVWVTAWARFELFKGIDKIGEDVVYCDTDSIKFLNYNKYKNWIEEYNQKTIEDLKKTANFYNFDSISIFPKNSKNEISVLGVWDFEGKYDKFKTLGAKRYAFEKNEKFSITVSGLNKKTACPYILAKSKKSKISPFDFFSDEMYIPKEYTGKNTHTYIDEAFEQELTDYNGYTIFVKESHYIHLCEQDYCMNLSSEFVNFLMYGFNGDLCKSHKIFEKQEKLAVNFWECDFNE